MRAFRPAAAAVTPPPLRRLARFLIRLALSLLATAMGGPASAAPPRWIAPADTPFQHLTRESGLPHEIANAVAEDGAGFLWVGTYGGLVRWDGYRFRVYLADRLTPGALPDAYVRTLQFARKAPYDVVKDAFDKGIATQAK